MKASVMEFWLLLKGQLGWESLSSKQKLIIVWWCVSFFGILVDASLIVLAILLANFASATFCVIKYVPQPKDE